MLSVIVYGRNDMHGNNLQKRAAISLNCFAELLTDADDEIVFVDDNTPDELPTFPEAISDTLTETAQRLLRVIRIRAVHHEPIAALTHRTVVEPVARNAGIRRANPANRWILSTTTDMILVPKRHPGSLSAVCAELTAGCWHLPRFELPEAVWEACNRLDPLGTIAAVASWAPRLHLREIIYGSREAVFDNHGDFQLMLRADVEAIHGFDERMLSGWAVDSNLAKRMLLRLGHIGNLADRWDAYHCAHHRLPSPMHSGDRVENDYQRFMAEIERPDQPWQAACWGLADVALEEFRLAERVGLTGWTEKLAETLPPSPLVPPETRYEPFAPDQSDYPAETVAVHLLDLVAHRSPSTRLAWFGARPAVLAAVKRGWSALGFVHPIAVGTLADADIIVCEFGCASQDRPDLVRSRPGRWSDDDLRGLVPVHAGFLATVAEERHRQERGLPPRLIIAINAIHNRFEALVNEVITAGRNPFASRIRHGYVRATPSTLPLHAPAVARWLATQMPRRQPLVITEAVRLLSHLHQLMDEEPDPVRLRRMSRNAETLLTLIDHPTACARWPETARQRARAALEAVRGRRVLGPALALPVVAALPPPDTAPCRLATVEDWEDQAWLAMARQVQGAFAANLYRRSAADWARIQVMRQFERLGRLGRSRRLMVVAAGPDPMIDALTTRCDLVQVLPADAAAEARIVTAEVPGFRDPDRLILLPLGREPARAGYDGIVFLHGTLFDRGGGSLLTASAEWLRPGGVIAVVEPVTVSRDMPPPDFGSETTLALLPTAPSALTAATLDHAAWDDDIDRLPHFLACQAGTILTWGVWFLSLSRHDHAPELMQQGQPLRSR